ncbi:30S ribosomal protein S6 [Candidatus Omnitrophota bacterium]
MKKYEAMFIVRPDISEEEKKAVFNQIKETFNKFKATIVNASVWAEKRKLGFAIKKCQEGLYYLVDFTLEDTKAMSEIKRVLAINENILRFMIMVGQ